MIFLGLLFLFLCNSLLFFLFKAFFAFCLGKKRKSLLFWWVFLASFRGLPQGWVSKRVILADVSPERKPERGYIRMFPRNENRNKGTFGCSARTNTGTRVRSHVPPERKNWNEGTFARTTLLRNCPFGGRCERVLRFMGREVQGR